MKLPGPIKVGKNAPIRGTGNRLPKYPGGNDPFALLKKGENHVVNGVKSAVNTVSHAYQNAIDELGL